MAEEIFAEGWWQTFVLLSGWYCLCRLKDQLDILLHIDSCPFDLAPLWAVYFIFQLWECHQWRIISKKCLNSCTSVSQITTGKVPLVFLILQLSLCFKATMVKLPELDENEEEYHLSICHCSNVCLHSHAVQLNLVKCGSLKLCDSKKYASGF